MARRDDREYREYLSEEQRSQRGCIARRMQPDFRHGLLTASQRARRFSGSACGRSAVKRRVQSMFKHSAKQE